MIDWANAAIGAAPLDVAVTWIVIAAKRAPGTAAGREHPGRRAFLSAFLDGFDLGEVAAHMPAALDYVVSDPLVTADEAAAARRMAADDLWPGTAPLVGDGPSGDECTGARHGRGVLHHPEGGAAVSARGARHGRGVLHHPVGGSAVSARVQLRDTATPRAVAPARPIPLLECTGLRRSFGDRVALDGLSFSVGAGERYGLLGPNGAGKTTAISIVCGVLSCDAGSVVLDGRRMDVTSVAPKALVGYVPQEVALYPTLSARENLAFFGRMYAVPRRQLTARIEAALELVGLTARAADSVAGFSGGMQRRLNIAAALVHEPRLLVLDEPTAGVDPHSRRAILDMVRRLSDEGIAVLYTTHYMEEAQRLCNRIGILDEGRMIAEGTYEELVGLAGEHGRVRLRVAAAPPDLLGRLQTLDGVHAVAAAADDQDAYELVVADAELVVPAAFRVVERAGTTVTGLEVDEPDLEAVFLQMTGKALPRLTCAPFSPSPPTSSASACRDRSVLVMALIAPLSLTAIIGLAPFGRDFHATVALADETGGRLVPLVQRGLRESDLRGIVRVIEVDSSAAARRAVARHQADAALVVSPPRSVTVVETAASPVAGQMAVAIGDQIAGSGVPSARAGRARSPPPSATSS